MDTYSLEEEDCGALFLTQESRKLPGEGSANESQSEGSFLGLEPADFCSLCVSLVAQGESLGIYSDISEEEDAFEGQKFRYIFIRNSACNKLVYICK